MPPPPIGFLPPGGRQRPTRRRVSRKLWDEVRYQKQLHLRAEAAAASASADHRRETTPSTSKRAYRIALARAALYEIQPFRVRPLLRRARRFLSDKDGWSRVQSNIVEQSRTAAVYVRTELPDVLRDVRDFLMVRKVEVRNALGALVGLYVWFKLLAYAHEALHAGLIMLMLMLMVLLFAIGLGDNTGANSGVPSAYSVFNRGFQQLMGSANAEDLAAQYVGGAMGMAGGVNMARNIHNQDDNRGFYAGPEEEDGGGAELDDDDEDEQLATQERRRIRRSERLQRRDGDDGDADAVAVSQENGEASMGNDANRDAVANQTQDMQQNDVGTGNNNNRSAENQDEAPSRKSGKKARTKNLEMRREMQRQQQAAMELGFGAEGLGNVNEDAQQLNAMNRLVEDQAVDNNDADNV